MTKREKEKAAKRKQEIEEVRHELRLLAIGVAGHTAIEDDPNEEIGVYATLGSWGPLRREATSEHRFTR